MRDRFEGDAALQLTEDGSDLVYKDGQPEMDRGLENMALISLFTDKGWVGNSLMPTGEAQIGSDFVKNSLGPITLTKLNDIRQSASTALKVNPFSDTEIEVTNPRGEAVNVAITVLSPFKEGTQIFINRTNGNWIFQAQEPAHRRF